MNMIDTIQTPFFLYNLDLLDSTLAAAAEAADRHNYVVHYALKANNEPRVCKRVLKHGFGVDCVSGQEVAAAIEYGFSPDSVVFAGVGKSDDEIMLALNQDIFCINCESIEELDVIAQLASQNGKIARVALRVNPDVDAGTHRNITTGRDENKFGIHLTHLQKALDLCYASESLEFMGLHFHIGSQILSDVPFLQLCDRVNQIWADYNIDFYSPKILNLGGGLGIDYTDPHRNPMPDFDAFFKLFADTLTVPSHIQIHFELGRSLVGQSAVLYSKVLYVKHGVNKRFIISDAGMTELLRPALYQAVHKVENPSSNRPVQRYDVVGPACESSDVFARDLELPETNRGDLIVINSCGAYAQSMSLHYNLRPKARAYYTRNGNLCPESLPAELFQSNIV
jgi:diaminopimelate decarboxylase